MISSFRLLTAIRWFEAWLHDPFAYFCCLFIMSFFSIKSFFSVLSHSTVKIYVEMFSWALYHVYCHLTYMVFIGMPAISSHTLRFFLSLALWSLLHQWVWSPLFSLMIVEADGDCCGVGTYFMATKLFNTPDVVINPAKPYHWQTYDVKREHSVEMMKQWAFWPGCFGFLSLLLCLCSHPKVIQF